MHLHILPTMNPDGFSLKWRGNANNIDLNRDFPDQVSTRLCCTSFPWEASTAPFVHYFFSCSHSIDTDWNWQFFSVNNDINYRQPETRAIMNWIKQEHFTASASLHGVIFSSTCSYVILLVEMRSCIIFLFDFFFRVLSLPIIHGMELKIQGESF